MALSLKVSHTLETQTLLLLQHRGNLSRPLHPKHIRICTKLLQIVTLILVVSLQERGCMEPKEAHNGLVVSSPWKKMYDISKINAHSCSIVRYFPLLSVCRACKSTSQLQKLAILILCLYLHSNTFAD